MTEKHFILATAGHVDHGKSALIKALTGTDPDRLPEEKIRGITIELGFAQLVLNDAAGQRLRIGIVDVPGHEDFVRNMIAGIGGVDLGLLTVAADDGWMRQTEEHFQILGYLGVRRAIVALTKTDLGSPDQVLSQIRERLSDTRFANSRVVATSVRTGEGIENLKQILAAEFAAMPPPREIGKPRLFIDRAFTLRGIGTVVTGTLTGGELRSGQSVTIQPRNISSRIRSIQSHGHDLDRAGPGMRTAISLPDVGIGVGTRLVQRGDVITPLGAGVAGNTLNVLMERSSRPAGHDPAARPLKHGASVYIHHGTTRALAKLLFWDNRPLRPGEQKIAQLRFESPLFAFVGDRFVARDGAERSTLGGGIILDSEAEPKKFDRVEQRDLLAAQARDPSNIDLCVISELARRRFIHLRALLHKSNFSTPEISASCSRLNEKGAIVLHGDVAADIHAWRDLRQRAEMLIDQIHQQRPEYRGLELTELQAAFRERSREIVDSLIEEMCRNGFVRINTTIARSSHRPVLPPQMESAGAAVRSALMAKRFDPPGRKDLGHLQSALRFLIQQGDVIEVSPEVVLLREASEQMRNAIVEFISRRGAATTSELRQHLGSSRRVIIPFLEYLDRAGVTRRTGEKRVLVRYPP